MAIKGYKKLFFKLGQKPLITDTPKMNPSKLSSADTFNQELQPVANNERIELLDVLRGFAICGILLANIPFFMGYYFMNGAQKASLPYEMANHLTIFLTHIFIEGKFYSIFSLLFGIGFAVQLIRAEGKGKSFMPFYIRRLALLLLIGLMHLILLWTGDILSSYAMVGFVLLLFRKTSNKALLLWVIFLLVLPVIQYLIVLASGKNIHPGTVLEIAGTYVYDIFGIEGEGSRLSAMQSGYLEWLQKNISGAFFRFSNLLYTGRFLKVLAMFLLGFYIGRNDMVRNIASYQGLLKRIFFLGFVFGIPLNIALAWLMELGSDIPASPLGLLQSVVYMLGVVPLSLGYIALFALVWQKLEWQKRLSIFSPIGKMGLTNYILQTIICLLIFNGFGLGLVGEIGPFTALPIIILIWIFQILFSKWWMRHFQFGPIEWIWRSLTYGKFQRITIKPDVTTA